MSGTQWLGVWLIVAAAVVMSLSVCTVAVGLAVILNRKDERRGGCRGRGCRPDSGRHGCTKNGPDGGPSVPDFATLARVGWVDVDMVRKWRGE